MYFLYAVWCPLSHLPELKIANSFAVQLLTSHFPDCLELLIILHSELDFDSADPQQLV